VTYFRTFYCGAMPMVARPETGDDGVALTQIASQEEECKTLFNRQKILATSTSKPALINASKKKKAPLLTEIGYTRDQLGNQFPAQIIVEDLQRDQTTLDQIVTALVTCCRVWKQQNNGEVTVRDDVFADCRSDPLIRTHELRDHHFGRLKHSVIQQFRNQTSYREVTFLKK